MLRRACMALVALGWSLQANSQDILLSPTPTQAVYEYQLNYQLPWQRYYGGPGLSLGGTMPTRGVFGYSTLNGIPFPGPLGAGVYTTGQIQNRVGPTLSPFGPVPMTLPGMAMAPPMVPLNPRVGIPSNSLGPMAVQPSANNSTERPQRKAANQPATPGARRMSVEQQNLGDAKLREQRWNQAYIHYRNSADLAPERPEAHFRLGLTFAAVKQYTSAIREFQRCLDLDRSLPASGDRLTTIFGDDNKVAKSTILSSAADWTREDLADPNRLFVLGLLLYFDDDPRGSEVLEAALRLNGPKEHIFLFLNPVREDIEVDDVSRQLTPTPAPPEINSSPPLSDGAVPPSPMPFDAPSPAPLMDDPK